MFELENVSDNKNFFPFFLVFTFVLRFTTVNRNSLTVHTKLNEIILFLNVFYILQFVTFPLRLTNSFYFIEKGKKRYFCEGGIHV